MSEQLLVLSPLIVTNLAAIWLWVRAMDATDRAERERDEAWDACTCTTTSPPPNPSANEGEQHG